MLFVEHFPLATAILAIIVFIFVIVILVRVIIHFISTPVLENEYLPIKYIKYENEIAIYMRKDGLLYQRIGESTQVQAVKLKDGTIHKLGNPISINPNELVKLIEIKHA